MPTIAVVEGPAVGSGCEIAGACDFIVATPEASFRTPEALRGTVGATQRLPRILGKRLAKDMMFTGRTPERGGGEGSRAGFETGSASDLEKTLAEIKKIILDAPPQSLRLAKRCIDRGVELDPQGRAGRRDRGDRGAARRPATGWARSELAAEDSRRFSGMKRSRMPKRWSRPSSRFTYKELYREGKTGRWRNADARHRQGRPRRDPDAERRGVAGALLRRRADRRGDRAGQHALQGRRDRFLPEEVRRQGAVLRRSFPRTSITVRWCRRSGFEPAIRRFTRSGKATYTPVDVASRRPASHPVHFRHHRISEGRDAHARQHAAQRLGGRHAHRRAARRTAISTAGRSST